MAHWVVTELIDKRFVVTCTAILAVGAGALFLARSPEPQEITAADENVQHVEQTEPASGQEDESAYYFKEYNGRVAVFLAGEDKPQIQLDVLVKYLPDYDREQMKKGIPVKDYEELQSMIEDYIS